MTAAKCQSPQLIAIYDALDGTALGNSVDVCPEAPTWLVRLMHAVGSSETPESPSEIAIEVHLCDTCTSLVRITPSFRRARTLAGERANV